MVLLIVEPGSLAAVSQAKVCSIAVISGVSNYFLAGFLRLW